MVLAVAVAMGGTAIWMNALGAGDRFDRLLARIEAIVDPPPRRSAVPTVVVTPRPTPNGSPSPGVTGPYDDLGINLRQLRNRISTPTPTPAPVRAPVDVTIIADHEAVFISQITNKTCAVAGTQMALAVMGLADSSEAFQNTLGARIGEWESWEDSHDGGWGPAAIAQALAAYGAPGYEIDRKSVV